MQPSIEERDSNGIIVLLVLIIFGGVIILASIGAWRMHKALTAEAQSPDILAKSEMTKAEIKNLHLMPDNGERRGK